MNYIEKRYTTSVLTDVAGCDLSRFYKWRERNGLFFHALRERGWTHFSFLDLCVARTVVVLIALGVRAQTAIDFASEDGARIILGLLKNERLPGYVLFGCDDFCTDDWMMDPEDHQGLAEFIWNEGGAVTILDLTRIIRHVHDQLGRQQAEQLLLSVADECA